jgi:alpha-tubulin suppressor-like RCC1 family protein
MSGFKTVDGDDFERMYMTTTDLVDQFVGQQLWAWGQNNSGQLGNGTITNTSSPVTVAGGGINWKQVAGRHSHAVAIKTDGTLWTWGYNSVGQLGDNTTTNRSSPGTTVVGGTNWKQVSASYVFTAAVKTDGTLWTWGYNAKGQLGDGTTTSRTSPVTTAGGGTNWKQVSCGDYHVAAVKTDGTLWAWGNGYSNYGQLGDGTTTSRTSPVTTAGGGTNWKQVSCGYNHTAAIKTDGTLWVWGRNDYGQLGNSTITNTSSPITPISGEATNWKQVSCGYRFTLAIKTDGTLWAWGKNNVGQLGNSTITNTSSPITPISAGTNWKQVSCGYDYTTAIKTDGTLWTWGNNTTGQLGDNTTTARSSPGTTVAGGTNWKQVSCGYFTAAIGI